MKWLKETRALSFNDYDALWQWSVNHIADFWETLFVYFDVQYTGAYDQVRSGNEMPFVSWFEGIQLNYTEHIFRNETTQYPAIIYQSENNILQTLSWKDLKRQVASLQFYLQQCGVKTGDRVAAYMPCTPQATIAFLAVNSLGAVWSSCSPDFGASAVTERFAQIKPRILIAVDVYQYGGKEFDKSEVITSLIGSIPSIEKAIVVSSKHEEISDTNDARIVLWEDIMKVTDHILQFQRVPFNHPIWILYSSGTTGLPKAITHSHGGILLEQLKYATFHNDFKPGDRCFWFTTTGWMMWNYIHGSLLTGATMVIYDGSPGYPDLHILWKFVQDAGINHFGTSAGYILSNKKSEIHPSQKFDLSSLRSIGCTGSTLPPEGFEWIYQEVKKDLWLASMSGGTDVCSAFVGGNPLWPVYSGEIQCRALGCKLESFDADGRPVINEVGEMVITEAMPSMPIYFWNDAGFERYRESYFNIFPSTWRHGDWIMITPRKGVIIYGRSDATLNRGGVRIGTSEIYSVMDSIPEIKDSLIVCIENSGGEFWMPLFIVMNEGVELTDVLRKKINSTIRAEYSPRHVPDEIIAAPEIPYTISGKKTETPVKNVLMGKDPMEAINTGALRNPDAMKFFIEFTRQMGS
jgi:acetoacetyl-CoA synthetase